MHKYEKLNKEAKVLFDYIIDFWNNVQEGENYSQEDYADVEYADRVFQNITGLTVEEIDLNGV